MSDETALKWMEPQYPGLAFYVEYVTEQPHRLNRKVYPAGTRVTCWTELNKNDKMTRHMMITPVSGRVERFSCLAPSAGGVS